MGGRQSRIKVRNKTEQSQIKVRNKTEFDIWGLKFRKNVIEDEKIEIFRRILPGETVIFDESVAITYRKG